MLRAKSAENILAAELLLQHKAYNSIPHCSYYACFQLLSYINGNKERPDKGEGSHDKVISSIYRDLKREDKKYQCKYKFNMTPSKIKDKIYALKDLRSAADYSNDKVDINLASLSINESKLLIKILNHFYEI